MMDVMEVDDSDLLHAVMAFLEDNDAMDAMGETSNSNGSFPLTDSESIKPQTTSTESPAEPQGVLPRLTPRRPKVNKSRQRMREELVSLREQVLELQDRLEQFQGGIASRVGIQPKPAAEEKEARKLRALAWQALAEHENIKKLSAESEQEKLRALLKEQKLAFRRLRRYLGKYSADSQWAPLKSELIIEGDEDKDANATADTTQQQAAAEFDEISRALPTMYLQISAVFADKRLEDLTTSVRELKVQNELTPQMSIESLDSRLVPFDVEQTARAVWEYHLTKVRKLLDHDDKKLEESEHSIRRVFSAGVKLAAVAGQARVRMETRRFVEPNRVVIVQSGIYDHIEMNKTHVDRFTLRQYQWTVIGPPRNAAMRASDQPITQVEVFQVTLPVLDHVSGMDRQQLLQRVKSICAESARVHMEIERESVECILMDSLLKGSNLSASMLELPRSIAAA